MLKAETLQSDRMKFLFELSRASDAPVDIPSPEGLEYRPFQKAGILYASLVDNVLFGDAPGLGKTIQSIGAMNLEGISSALVACPASLSFNWKKELEKWHLGKPKVEVLNAKTVSKLEGVDILIMSYALVSNKNYIAQVLKHFKFDLLVLDEFHYLKNPKSKRTKHALARNGLFGAAKKCHAISGTPIVNRPIELYPILKTINSEAIDNMSYFSYGLKYCKGFKGSFGWNFNGASNLKELGRRLRTSCMVRRTKELVLKDLPEKDINIVYLEPSKKADKLVKEYKDFDANSVVSNNLNKVEFDELSEHRRLLGVEKAPVAVDYIRNQLEGGHRKIIVFAHHKSVLDILNEGLAEYGIVEIRGSTPGAQRQRAVDCFQGNRNTRLFLGSITAAGVGLTLTASSYVIFVEPSWVPGENFQAMDRAHRIGQKNSVLVEFLALPGSLDERIIKTVIDKQKNIDEVME